MGKGLDMEAVTTLKVRPYEFDLLRQALEAGVEKERQLQQNIKDENMDTKGVVRVRGNKAFLESQQREAGYAQILANLR